MWKGPNKSQQSRLANIDAPSAGERYFGSTATNSPVITDLFGPTSESTQALATNWRE
jgi:hypothetical protein